MRERPASDGKICSRCKIYVADEMMTEFWGYDWLDEPTMDELRSQKTEEN